MPTFRVVQAGKSVDIAAHTIMEARARAVLSGDFVAGDSLIAYLAGDIPPAAAAQTAAAPAALPALEAERMQPSLRRQGPLGPLARFRQAPIGRQLLSLIMLIVLLFAVLIGGGWFITASATAPGQLGECARIGLCTNTPLTTVTDRTGVTFPDGTERLRSTASRDGSWISALVQLPDGAAPLTLAGGTETAVTDRAAAALESAGATELTGLVAGLSVCSPEPSTATPSSTSDMTTRTGNTTQTPIRHRRSTAGRFGLGGAATIATHMTARPTRTRR